MVQTHRIQYIIRIYRNGRSGRIADRAKKARTYQNKEILLVFRMEPVFLKHCIIRRFTKLAKRFTKLACVEEVVGLRSLERPGIFGIPRNHWKSAEKCDGHSGKAHFAGLHGLAMRQQSDVCTAAVWQSRVCALSGKTRVFIDMPSWANSEKAYQIRHEHCPWWWGDLLLKNVFYLRNTLVLQLL